MSKICLSTLVVVVSVGIIACSSSDPGGSTSGGTTSSSSSSSSGSSGSGGTCTGDISTCPIGSLSSAQQSDMCDTLAAASDDPPGTKYECMATGDFITVNSKDQCIAQPAKSTCKVTLTYLLNCYKQAKTDACSAFDTGGACVELFDPAQGCT